MESHVTSQLQAIDSFISRQLYDTAYIQYQSLINKIENNELSISPATKADVYSSFAYFLFSASEYGHFFAMLIKAQEYGYPKDQIKSVLFEGFIGPNLKEYEDTYKSNIAFLESHTYFDNSLDFNDLPYWLLPTGVENEYYFYDKSLELITDKLTMPNSQLTLPPFTDEFSDCIVIEDWNVNTILFFSNLINVHNKKTYAIVTDYAKFLSCLQGIQLDRTMFTDTIIFDSLHSFNSYFRSTSSSLPRNVYNLSNQKSTILDCIDVLHRERLNSNNRRGDRVLLSICMPSYNRGKKALDNILHLLTSYYDEEIEIIISNNGTQNDTKDYYKKIKDIDDSRLVYYEFEDNQGFAINLCKVCELASGKFMLLISDEDLVNYNVLDKVMNILRQADDTLSLVKTASTTQNKPQTKHTKPGRDSLLTFMLTSNYMSGMILNKDNLLKCNALEIVRDNVNTNSVYFYYPHMYFELLLSQHGSVIGTDLVLIQEGEPDKTEVPETVIANNLSIPYHATIEGRLEQHGSFTRIFNDLEICQDDYTLFREMYFKLYVKTMHLVRVSIKFFYSKENFNLRELFERAFRYCTSEELLKSHSQCDQESYQFELEKMKEYYILVQSKL